MKKLLKLETMGSSPYCISLDESASTLKRCDADLIEDVITYNSSRLLLLGMGSGMLSVPSYGSNGDCYVMWNPSGAFITPSGNGVVLTRLSRGRVYTCCCGCCAFDGYSVPSGLDLTNPWGIGEVLLSLIGRVRCTDGSLTRILMVDNKDVYSFLYDALGSDDVILVMVED